MYSFLFYPTFVPLELLIICSIIIANIFTYLLNLTSNAQIISNI